MTLLWESVLIDMFTEILNMKIKNFTVKGHFSVLFSERPFGDRDVNITLNGVIIYCDLYLTFIDADIPL